MMMKYIALLSLASASAFQVGAPMLKTTAPALRSAAAPQMLVPEAPLAATMMLAEDAIDPGLLVLAGGAVGLSFIIGIVILVLIITVIYPATQK